MYMADIWLKRKVSMTPEEFERYWLEEHAPIARDHYEHLNGYVVTEGKKAGVPTPVNEAVVDLYRRHGVGTLRPDPKNLEPLLKLLPA